jgi:hypothetical protein
MPIPIVELPYIFQSIIRKYLLHVFIFREQTLNILYQSLFSLRFAFAQNILYFRLAATYFSAVPFSPFLVALLLQAYKRICFIV